MNDLTSPELVEQINPNNMQLKMEFLDYLRSGQKSEGTINGYSNDLDIFFVYNLQHLGNKDYSLTTKKDFIRFQNWLLNENENSPARIRRIRSAIQSMDTYIENILDDEPEYENFRSSIRKVPPPVNQTVRTKSVFQDDQMEWLLDELVKKGQYEKACMLALAICSGRRKSELTRFKVHYFDEENLVCDGALYKTPEPVRTKGFGNGKYIHLYTLAKKFKPYFDMWMKHRADHGIESEWLFPMKNDNSKHMKPETLNSWADTFTRMLGEDFYWHSMRHFFTTNMSRAGLPDGVIQSLVGWESGDMVRLYNDISAEEQIGMYFKGGEISVPENNGFNF